MYCKVIFGQKDGLWVQCVKGGVGGQLLFCKQGENRGCCIFTFSLCFNGRKKAVRGSAKCEAMSFSIARGGIGRVQAAAAAQQKWVCQSLISSSVATQAFMWAKVFRKSYSVMSVRKYHTVFKTQFKISHFGPKIAIIFPMNIRIFAPKYSFFTPLNFSA